jgi:hypothetical protein
MRYRVKAVYAGLAMDTFATNGIDLDILVRNLLRNGVAPADIQVTVCPEMK